MTKGISLPQIMGILNITPDSFSDGGNYHNTNLAIEKGLKMIEDGADILDIGGESTRPGAESVDTKTELGRVIPVINELKKRIPHKKISIDTTKYEVAREAIYAGADIINDISGLNYDIRLAELAAKENKALIIMHMQGNPRTMQAAPQYENVVSEVKQELASKIQVARRIGVKTIYADVGIGFGKSLDHNIELLKHHDEFEELGVNMVIGISRKSFIGKLFNLEEPVSRDVHTAFLHALLLDKNVAIFRVHNVKLHKELIDTSKILQK